MFKQIKDETTFRMEILVFYFKSHAIFEIFPNWLLYNDCCLLPFSNQLYNICSNTQHKNIAHEIDKTFKALSIFKETVSSFSCLVKKHWVR